MDEIKSFAQGRPQHTDNDDDEQEDDYDDDGDDDNDVDEIKSFTQGHRNGGVTTKIEVSILIMMIEEEDNHDDTDDDLKSQNKAFTKMASGSLLTLVNFFCAFTPFKPFLNAPFLFLQFTSFVIFFIHGLPTH